MAHVKVNLSLEESTAAAMRRLAAEEGKPVSQYLARLIREDEQRCRDELAEEGYRLLGRETRSFAEEALPLAAEIWPGEEQA